MQLGLDARWLGVRGWGSMVLLILAALAGQRGATVEEVAYDELLRDGADGLLVPPSAPPLADPLRAPASPPPPRAPFPAAPPRRVPARTDHSDDVQVEELFGRIGREAGRLGGLRQCFGGKAVAEMVVRRGRALVPIRPRSCARGVPDGTVEPAATPNGSALGCAGLIAGMALLALGLALSSLVLLVCGGVLAGLGQGLSFRAGPAALNSEADADPGSYTHLALPTLGFVLISVVCRSIK